MKSVSHQSTWSKTIRWAKEDLAALSVDGEGAGDFSLNISSHSYLKWKKRGWINDDDDDVYSSLGLHAILCCCRNSTGYNLTIWYTHLSFS